MRIHSVHKPYHPQAAARLSGISTADAVARRRGARYFLAMGPSRLVLVVAVAGLVTAGAAAVAGLDPAVPLYTSDDLDRMFGPAPAQPSEPVDKTRPEDWRWIEQFLDRQYSRIDADRRYDLDSRTVDIVEGRVAPSNPYSGGAAAWRLGYPASTWWNNVASRYGVNTYVGYGYSHGRDSWAAGGSTGCGSEHGRGSEQGHGQPAHHK